MSKKLNGVTDQQKQAANSKHDPESCLCSWVTRGTFVALDFVVYLDVKTLGSEFVVGVIQAIDSEHDPRNLVCVFTVVRLVAQNFALGEYVIFIDALYFYSVIFR